MPEKVKSALPQFITRKQAAVLMACSVQSVDKMIGAGILTAFRPVGRRVILRFDQVMQWIEACRGGVKR